MTFARSMLLALVPMLLMATGASADTPDFITFESGPVRPLALSANGKTLFAVNTPDGYLEILDVSTGAPVRTGWVAVGMEPVAVAIRPGDPNEVWVVNHLSDSVSIVDVENRMVRRTLLVGDEPRDVVFANGPGERDHAFITTARRGQHRTHPSIAHVGGAGDPLFTTPGIPRADVWVFDAENLDGDFAEETLVAEETLGGVPRKIVELFGDTARALAVKRDPLNGDKVYAAVFHSGNQTTVVGAGEVCDRVGPVDAPCVRPAGVMPGGSPGPDENAEGKTAPAVGLIVKYLPDPSRIDPNRHTWQDELGRDWSSAVRIDLPDEDVFGIDARTLEPIDAQPLEPGTNGYSGVGTVLFNMVVAPDGKLLVSNSEAVNEVRFEGPGVLASDSSTLGVKPSGDPSTVQGHIHEMRISVIGPGGTVTPRHLNRHIDYSRLAHEPGFDEEAKHHSLSIPLDMVVSSAGKLYVAAFGSQKIGVFDVASVAEGTFWPPDLSDEYIPVSGGGPAGLALDETRKRLYVFTRFDNAVAGIDLNDNTGLGKIALENPEPPEVRDGRPFLYDAQFSSANGEASCASCHVFGDLDSLAWDLGNPDDEMTPNTIPIRQEAGARILFAGRINGTGEVRKFHPMKGPMTTQTLRGMVNHGAMHWRGDRLNLGNHTDSTAAFKKFIVAFEGLLGRKDLPDEGNVGPGTAMDELTQFILEVTLPPNPVRALDNSLTDEQRRGMEFYFGEAETFGRRRSDGVPFGDDNGFTCNGCHVLEPENGFFGTDGGASFEAESQIFKIPHLRNVYTKIGMFGMPPNLLVIPRAENFIHQGPQVRGFGFLHDGSFATMLDFFHAVVFANTGLTGFRDEQERLDMEQFMLAFDNDLAPIVGQQVTLTAKSGGDVEERIDLLIARAKAEFTSKILGGKVRECDLVVRGTFADAERSWLYDPVGKQFISDQGAGILDEALESLADQAPLTYTCVPPGSGKRVAALRAP